MPKGNLANNFIIIGSLYIIHKENQCLVPHNLLRPKNAIGFIPIPKQNQIEICFFILKTSANYLPTLVLGVLLVICQPKHPRGDTIQQHYRSDVSVPAKIGDVGSYTAKLADVATTPPKTTHKTNLRTIVYTASSFES